ncbi:MAG TPA: glycosyltransferase, partial [Solirubrobacteraceae bacterium]|nr:glycosyltransferase [Solirubrobacteraceae bacterium]
FAARVCLAFPRETRGRRLFGRRSRRYSVTGRPVPESARDGERARERLGIGAEETCVVVFGGSLGARSINRAAAEAFAGSDFRVLHISGRRDYGELRSRELPPGYDLREFLGQEDFADALAAADLAVARSGGSVFEIAAHGVPAVLVPYPHASGDHQSANARWMVDAGAAVVIRDEELTAAGLARQVAELLADRTGLEMMAAASRSLARPNAAREIAAELLAVACG